VRERKVDMLGDNQEGLNADSESGSNAYSDDTYAQQLESEPEKVTMEFEAWYAVRGVSIPAHHHREILRADFRARGVPNKASLEDYDKALLAYGIKLA
jgi:hypothetical protein